MSDTPLRGPTKPIEQMTPLELENYRAMLKQETERISARLQELLKRRKQHEKQDS